MIINERTLQDLLQCPLIVPAKSSHEEECSNEMTKWILRQAFDGKLKGESQAVLHAIRGKVISTWQGDKKDIGILARTIAFRLFSLVLDFEVIHLEQPYQLVLDKHVIQGSYALLRKRAGERLFHILINHTNVPEIKKKQALPPDIVTLSRYTHLYTTTEYTDAQILHYPIFRGKAWLNKHINITLAKSYLNSILVTAANNPQYPVVGKHCDNCVTKPCMEAFKNG